MIRQTVPVAVQKLCVVHRLFDMRPHPRKVLPVACPKVISAHQQHELRIHINAVVAVIHAGQVWGKEMVHTSILALEFCTHLHLFFLKVREKRQNAKRTLVSDVCRMEAAAAVALPHAELAPLCPPGAFDQCAQMI